MDFEELQGVVELLTLDKEQLLLEKELLEEKIADLQLQLMNTGISSSGIEEQEGEQLKIRAEKAEEENEKLRAALIRFGGKANADKEALQIAQQTVASLQTQVDNLTMLNNNLESAAQESAATIDSLSASADLIEDLTSKHLDSMATIQDLQTLVSDLQDNKELLEELDSQQRAEIDHQRETIAALTVQISTSQQELAERNNVLIALGNKNDRFIEMLNESRKEIERLSRLVAAEDRDARQVSAKLRTAANLRRRCHELEASIAHLRSAALTSGSSESTHSLITKNRAIISAARCEAFCSGIPPFREETQRLGTELLLLTTVSYGYATVRTLVNTLDSLQRASNLTPEIGLSMQVDGDDSKLPDVYYSAIAPPIANAYTSSAVFLISILGRTLTHIREWKSGTSSDAATAAIEATRQFAAARDIFENMLSTSAQLQSCLATLILATRTMHEAEIAGEDTVAMQSEVASNNTLIHESCSLLTSQSLSMRTLLVRMSSNSSSSGSDEQSSTIPLTNTLDTLLNGVLRPVGDPSLWQIESLCWLLLPLTESLRVSSLLQHIEEYRDLLSSLHSEAHSCVRHLRRGVRSIASNWKDLHDIIIGVASLIDNFSLQPDDARDTLRVVLTTLRRVNNTLNTAYTSSSIAHSDSVGTSFMKFYPSALMCASLKGTDEVEVDGQFSEVMDRLWGMLSQSSPELLAWSAGLSLSDASALAAVPQWKDRVTKGRLAIEQIFVAPTAADSSNLVQEKIDSSVESTPVNSSVAMVPRTVHNAALAELNIKREELAVAAARCTELTEQLDNLASRIAAQPSSSRRSLNQSEVTDETSAHSDESLISTVRTLEAALAAVERKAESLSRDNKSLKSALNATSSAVPRGSDSPATSEAGKLGGKKSSAADLLSLLNNVPSAAARGVGGKQAPQHQVSSSLATVVSMLDQVDYWRQVATRDLLDTLRPLRPLRGLHATPSDVRTELVTSLPTTGEIVSVSAPTVLGQPNVDLRTAYLKSRLSRVKSLSLDSSTPKLHASPGERSVLHGDRGLCYHLVRQQ